MLTSLLEETDQSLLLNKVTTKGLYHCQINYIKRGYMMSQIYKKDELALHILTKQDIPSLIELTRSIGWDYNKEELNTIFSSGKVFGHRNKEGENISAAAIIPYENNKLASIGMVLVRKDYRGLRLGQEVTQACIDSVDKETPTILVATEEGKHVYKKMGFKTTDFVHKIVCDHFKPIKVEVNEQVEALPFSQSDVSKIVELDAKNICANREQFLFHRIKQSKEAVVVKCQSGNIVGFGLSIITKSSLVIGPLIAPDNVTASVIINQLVGRHTGKVRIDISPGHDSYIQFLEKQGFNQITKRPLMVINHKFLPDRSVTLYGISGQTFG